MKNTEINVVPIRSDEPGPEGSGPANAVAIRVDPPVPFGWAGAASTVENPAWSPFWVSPDTGRRRPPAPEARRKLG